MKIMTRTLFIFSVLLAPAWGLAQVSASQEQRVEDYRALMRVLYQYTNNAEAGDAEAMQPSFHPQAMTYGYLMGQLVIDSPQLYFDFVKNQPTPASVGENLMAAITHVQIDGPIAAATIQFANHWCASGTNHLGLLKTDAGWRIISMTFWVRPEPADADHSSYPEGYCTADSTASDFNARRSPTKK